MIRPLSGPYKTMRLLLLENTTPPVLTCAGSITTEHDALDIISAVYEHGAARLLLEEAQLPERFFDLKTGFAGAFVQKLINYRITTAAVFGARRPYPDGFREYIDEARSGRQFRVFTTKAEALHWLAGHA